MDQVNITETKLAKYYEICEIVSTGQFSNVYLVRKLQQKYRLKTIAKVFANASNCDELMFLSHFNHPNIVRIVDRFKHYYRTERNETRVLGCLVMEKCDFRLRTLLASDFEKLPKFAVKHITYQILDGLNYMHRMNVMHRDLNPGNILIGDNLAIKIASFRFVAFVHEKQPQQFTGKVGEMAYRAPEILRGQMCYTKSVDLWSVGCLMAEMFVHKTIFGGCKSEFDQLNLIKKMLSARKPNFREFVGYKYSMDQLTTKLDEILIEKTECGASSLKLINRLLNPNAFQRISAYEALQHRCFRKIRDEYS